MFHILNLIDKKLIVLLLLIFHNMMWIYDLMYIFYAHINLTFEFLKLNQKLETKMKLTTKGQRGMERLNCGS